MGSLLARRIDEHVETRVKAGIEAGIARELESAVAREVESAVAREVESAVAREEARLAREMESAVAREEARLAREMESAVAREEARLAHEMESAVARTRAETLEQGLERERTLLSRQAARKFGAGAGARLAALLAGVADPDRLAKIGDLVVDCADGAELLARAQEEANRR